MNSALQRELAKAERELELVNKEAVAKFLKWKEVNERAHQLSPVFQEQRDRRLAVAPSNYKLTPGNIEYIIDMFDKTSSGINALAFQFRVAPSTIRYHLKKHNILKKGQRLARR